MTQPNPKAKVAQRAGASEGTESADGADDSKSRGDKDDDANDNVCERRRAPRAARLRAADVRRVHRADGYQPRPRLPSGRQPDGHAPLRPAARRRDGLARRLVPDQRAVQRPIQHLGIEVGIEHAFGLRSTAGADGSELAGKTFGNSVHEYAGGLRYRFRSARGTRSGLPAPSVSTRSCSRARATAATAGRCCTSLTPSTVTAGPGSGASGVPRISPSPSAADTATSSTPGAPTSTATSRTGPSAAWTRTWRSVTGSDAQPRDPRLRPAAPLLLRHAFEGRRHLHRGWRDRSILDRRPRDGASARRQRRAERPPSELRKLQTSGAFQVADSEERFPRAEDWFW